MHVSMFASQVKDFSTKENASPTRTTLLQSPTGKKKVGRAIKF